MLGRHGYAVFLTGLALLCGCSSPSPAGRWVAAEGFTLVVEEPAAGTASAVLIDDAGVEISTTLEPVADVWGSPSPRIVLEQEFRLAQVGDAELLTLGPGAAIDFYLDPKDSQLVVGVDQATDPERTGWKTTNRRRYGLALQ